MFKCVNCGNLFEEGEQKTWKESRGECFGFPTFETMSGCPCCGENYEEAISCNDCGGYFFKDELFEGYCEKCLTAKINYQNALKYLQANDELCEFVFIKIFKLSGCKETTDELREEMRQLYLRYVTDDKIRKSDEFLNYIKNYIMENKTRKSIFAEYVEEEV